MGHREPRLPGRSADLVAVALSYDKGSHHGLQSPFSETLSRLWAGGMWHVDPTHNTFIATGDGWAEPTTAEATLFYDGGKGRYNMKQRLLPNQQMWIDVGRLVHDQIPDSDGRTIPPDVMTGSYELRDVDHPLIGSLYEGKLVIDKTYGHATYGCGLCCGYIDVVLIPAPFDEPPGIDNDDVIQTEDTCSGEIVDVTSAGYNWGSSNTAVATLPNPTLHTIATGTATGGAEVELQGPGRAERDECPTPISYPDQPIAVCDFTIAPANVVAQNCTGSSQNSNNFATTITPAGNSCLADQTKSTCSEAITEGSNIDFAVGSPKCVFNLGNPAATVTYYAGPALPNGTAGGISMTFNLVFGGTSDSHTDNAAVECPQ